MKSGHLSRTDVTPDCINGYVARIVEWNGVADLDVSGFDLAAKHDLALVPKRRK